MSKTDLKFQQDLRIVEGCAKALGKKLFEIQGLIGSYYAIGDSEAYWPLSNKDQAIDLAIALRLKMNPQELILDSGYRKVPGWRVEAENSVAPHYNTDLVRAICECAAELNGVRI